MTVLVYDFIHVRHKIINFSRTGNASLAPDIYEVNEKNLLHKIVFGFLKQKNN